MSTSRSAQIHHVIDTILRPLLEMDGGGIDVIDLADDGSSIELRLTGAFRGDPTASLVREHVVDPALRKAVREIVIKYTH